MALGLGEGVGEGEVVGVGVGRGLRAAWTLETDGRSEAAIKVAERSRRKEVRTVFRRIEFRLIRRVQLLTYDVNSYRSSLESIGVW